MIRNKFAAARGTLLSKAHARENVEDRLSRRYAGAIGDLNRWVDDVHEATHESIPYLDPDAAASGARILLLLQDPSGAADGDSGFISRDNNDGTANNYNDAAERAGVPHEYILSWNVVPWWSTNNPAHPGRTAVKEAERAAPYLVDFITRLPERPRVIVLVGGEAQKAWKRIAPLLGTALTGVEVLCCPHPSPLAYNKISPIDGRPNSYHIVAALKEASRIATVGE